MNRPTGTFPECTDATLCVEGRLVRLRPLRAADCGTRYLSWLRDPAVNRWLESRWYDQTLESITAYATACIADPYTLLMAIERLDDDQHIGNIKLGPIDPHHRCSDVGYFIGEQGAWGLGFATEAVRLIVGIAFDKLHLHRLQAGVYMENGASKHVLERIGFREEGRQREALVGPDGGREDLVLLGLLSGGRRSPSEDPGADTMALSL